ncbi:MAG TPA: aryl-sulfate sulfotransferase, partial [Saprospiraceae bacterium]|nr:aryl-sulfate sulfotransferase [Saprospiraceae bacterium]
MKTKFLLLFLLYTQFCTSQDGILLNTSDATNGYSLFTAQGRTYLVDNCGEIVNSWSIPFAVRHCKLLPDGNILYMSNGTIEERNWDDQFIKSILLNGVGLILEYEVIKLKNGNYLCVGREQVSLQKFEEYGYDIPFTNPTLSDVVIEVDGNNGEVVWRWNLFDHVIQDKFPNKRGYGVLKDKPGKIDINAISTVYWNFTESFMINGMDYNEELDQIVLSVRKIGEIVIIDHSTTTEQAKGSTGGKYNKGGDLLYRYGNPANYDRAPESSRQLYFQHNPNWIKYGEHKDKIMVFNN